MTNACHKGLLPSAGRLSRRLPVGVLHGTASIRGVRPTRLKRTEYRRTVGHRGYPPIKDSTPIASGIVRGQSTACTRRTSFSDGNRIGESPACPDVSSATRDLSLPWARDGRVDQRDQAIRPPSQQQRPVSAKPFPGVLLGQCQVQTVCHGSDTRQVAPSGTGAIPRRYAPDHRAHVGERSARLPVGRDCSSPISDH